LKIEENFFINDIPAITTTLRFKLYFSNSFSVNDTTKTFLEKNEKNNDGKKPFKIKTVNTREYVCYQHLIENELKKQNINPKVKNLLTSDLLACEIVYHPKQNKDGTASNVRPDVTNIEKGLVDILQYKKKRGYGYLFKDDKQIVNFNSKTGKSNKYYRLTVNFYNVKIIK
jgi:Holliday junction resolvase RusA-like endonuclease